jgi:hypothetical protein
MTETPIRPDRSRDLAREGRGRLDRLDLWLILVIVVAAMGVRMFRLAEPARMHFDEVYHARTAAEFLQDWRYGISHNIYEWTHPHLAKYAMAGGIVLFAGHDVRAEGDLGVAVRDAAIEPRRESPEDANARDGDRAWVATGDELIAYDLETREVAARWSLPGASAVAFDPAGTQLLVGTDGGDLLVLDALSLDARVEPGRPPRRAVPRRPLDRPIAQLAAFDGGQRVAALLPGTRWPSWMSGRCRDRAGYGPARRTWSMRDGRRRRRATRRGRGPACGRPGAGHDPRRRRRGVRGGPRERRRRPGRDRR